MPVLEGKGRLYKISRSFHKGVHHPAVPDEFNFTTHCSLGMNNWMENNSIHMLATSLSRSLGVNEPEGLWNFHHPLFISQSQGLGKIDLHVCGTWGWWNTRLRRVVKFFVKLPTELMVQKLLTLGVILILFRKELPLLTTKSRSSKLSKSQGSWAVNTNPIHHGHFICKHTSRC